MLCQKKFKIISNKNLKNNYFKLTLKVNNEFIKARPGQFVHVRITNQTEPLLRRPFSIHKVSSKKIEILYEIKGKGTEILSEKKRGEPLDIIGPLGNGFDSRASSLEPRHAILVAGGIGVAPLVFLAQKIKQPRPLVLLGANTKQKVVCADDFRKLGCKVKIATDDGSQGFKGKVTALLKTILLMTYDLRLMTIYACGPNPMLHELASIGKRYNIECQGSFENFMGCGIGACLGCVIKTKFGYKRVCKDGPVFKL